MRAGPLRDEQRYQEKLRQLQQAQQAQQQQASEQEQQPLQHSRAGRQQHEAPALLTQDRWR
jgi:hypothetical protein